jgi:septal ring factor EnvC (AmiA/AmiB activator)
MEDNIQVVEEAIFFKSNTKFQEIINKQIQEIKDNSSEIKRQKNILEDLIQDIRNTADDIEVAKKNKPKTKAKKKTKSDGSDEVKSESQ